MDAHYIVISCRFLLSAHHSGIACRHFNYLCITYISEPDQGGDGENLFENYAGYHFPSFNPNPPGGSRIWFTLFKSFISP